MGRRRAILWASLALLFGSGATCAATLETAGQSGANWLAQKRNIDDGSWGATDGVKYIQTAEAVLALGALNKMSVAYYGGVGWLGNHAPSNIDFTAHRVLALGTANQSVAADLKALQAAQGLTAPGNSGWGLSDSYLGSPLDTALSLQAMTQQGVSTNVAPAITYLLGAQLSGTDSGWAIGNETVSDPMTTAQVLLALIPLKASNAAVPAAITKGFTALNAKVSTASPVPQAALAIIANLRNDPNSSKAITLLNGLLAQQDATSGSWGQDPYATALALRAVAAGAGKDLAAQKQVVNIPDTALRAAINAALGIGALDQLTVGQMQQLTSLEAAGQGIADLTGLQSATKLTYLNLSNNNINSFAPVAGLTGTTIIKTGNPGDTSGGGAGGSSGDVPTLPEWGAILLGSLLLGISLRRERSIR